MIWQSNCEAGKSFGKYESVSTMVYPVLKQEPKIMEPSEKKQFDLFLGFDIMKWKVL